jgi:tetratricopeptide (TPR) repeat protein
MATNTIARLLDSLNQPGFDPVDLAQMSQDPENRALWEGDPQLYRAFGRKLISLGHYSRAFELIREGLGSHSGDDDLLYLQALALARGGNVTKATEWVGELLRERRRLAPALRVEALSLAGRLQKDRYERAGDTVARQRYAMASARFYIRAYRLSGKIYPAINAATMSLLAGRRPTALRLARAVVKQAQSERDRRGAGRDYWLLATLGEACLVLGEMAPAADWYRQAARLASDNVGDVASIRRNVRLLAGAIEGTDVILAALDIGAVVVFSGHMVDHPANRGGRGGQPRFPADVRLEKVVGRAIAEQLDRLNAKVGYCSAACGSDILFAERMLQRRAELHVILPFSKGDFLRTSVDFGQPAMMSWRRRFEAVLQQAAMVHYATTERHLGDDILFEFCNSLIQGLSLTRAAELGTRAIALGVCDATGKGGVGGTQRFLKRWESVGGAAHVIDLAVSRQRLGSRGRAALKGTAAPPPRRRSARRGRQIKAMLFADLKNFSKLPEEHMPAFFVQYLDVVAAELKVSSRKPIFRNTWGDGLFMVFNRVSDCADFALRLLDRVRKINWKAMGLPADTTVRMGLHAGPVFPSRDPILLRTNYFGGHVARAARIEPVTIPGCAFASEQFAALLALEPGRAFVCEYIGIEPLAKEFDRCPLYRLTRR